MILESIELGEDLVANIAGELTFLQICHEESFLHRVVGGFSLAVDLWPLKDRAQVVLVLHNQQFGLLATPASIHFADPVYICKYFGSGSRSNSDPGSDMSFLVRMKIQWLLTTPL